MSEQFDSAIQVLTLIVQVLTLIVLFVTAAIFYCQLQASQLAYKGATLVGLLQFLQAQDVRSARHKVLVKLVNKDFSAWNGQDRESASKVCASYGTAAVLEKLGLIDVRFLDGWRPSFIKCIKICMPLIVEHRRVFGSKYDKELADLYDRFVAEEEGASQ